MTPNSGKKKRGEIEPGFVATVRRKENHGSWLPLEGFSELFNSDKDVVALASDLGHPAD